MKQLTVCSSISSRSIERLTALDYTILLVSKKPKVYTVKADKILRGK